MSFEPGAAESKSVAAFGYAPFENGRFRCTLSMNGGIKIPKPTRVQCSRLLSCKYFLQGKCWQGTNCAFLHDENYYSKTPAQLAWGGTLGVVSAFLCPEMAAVVRATFALAVACSFYSGICSGLHVQRCPVVC